MATNAMSTGPAYPPPETDPAASEATRYLCAAGYLDERFARAVVEEVVHQPHRAVAPSNEIRLDPIIRHCLTARRRALIRDCVVTAFLVLAVLLAFSQGAPTGLATIVTLVSLGLLIRAVQLLLARRLARGLVVLAVFLVVGPALALVAAPVLALFGLSLYDLTTIGQAYDEDGYPVVTGPSIGTLWLGAIVLVWAAYVTYRLLVHHTIAVKLAAGTYDPRRAPDVDRVDDDRLAYIGQAEVGNVSVYSDAAGARPFVGFGEISTTWTLTSQLMPVGTPGVVAANASTASNGSAAPNGAAASNGRTIDRHEDPDPSWFSVDQLYDAIRGGLAELADPSLHPDDAIPHLSVRDRVFVAGRLPVNSPFLEHGRPRFRISGPDLAYVEGAERGRLRHYQCVRMSGWDGEVEVTTFLYVSVRGRMLFVEFVATVMPGILAAYHAIDTYERLDALTVARCVGLGFGDLLRAPLAPVAVGSAAAAYVRRALERSAEDRQISRQLMFDYGCRRSVRELGTDFVEAPLFQLLDANERVDVVEKRLLHVLVDFLRDRGFDVADLVDQVTTVINNTTNTNNFTNSTLNSSPVAAGNASTVSARTGPTAAGGPARTAAR